MTQEQFEQDLQLVYDELQIRQKSLNDYYKLLDGGHSRAEMIVDAFLKLIDIPKDDDSVLASLTRIVNLREDSLEQVLEKGGFTEEEILIKKELAYGFVSTIHITHHEGFLSWIDESKLLTPFYRSLMFGLHLVGARLSTWQSKWTKHVINGVNKELSNQYDGDDAKVLAMLKENNLLDLNPDGEVGDRCYSVLTKDENGDYRSSSYVEAFPNEVDLVLEALNNLISMLNKEEDDVFNQKDEWILYFTAIIDALSHTQVDELIGKWADVDRAWMTVKTPIQVGHPLEYYEDHYRKAVALEWDLRVVNPKLQEGSQTRSNIKEFSMSVAKELGGNAVEVIENNLTQVDETQLYIGQPILYYAAEFNGLFSAQVVPNDEDVSKQLGKKIFAYADFVMESKKAKPTMKLSVETMGEEFIRKQKNLIENSPKLWHEIYDISTVGHEYGHILWIQSDTESTMNTTGQFKNIEEIKATSGGLMAFFSNERDDLKDHIVNDVVSRAVGLMAWREVGEVVPYYCEGLIHLDILFNSKVISYDGKVKIDYSAYDTMKNMYKEAYKDLANNYLKKIDAGEYLSQYTVKEDGIYLPKNENIKSFVEHYYARYKEIGQQTVKLS